MEALLKPSGALPSKYKEFRIKHPSKHSLPINLTEDGMVRDVRLLHMKYLLLVDYQYYTF